MSSSAASGHRSLKWRVVGAGGWTTAGYGLGQALRLGGNLVITRLLMPDMFGVMAISGVVMTALALFSDVGLLPNIIQNSRGNDPAFLNTAWVIQILRGATLWLIALGISAAIGLADHLGIFPASTVYADPRLPYVLAVSSFAAVITGFQSTKLLEARRNLTLGKNVLTNLAAQVVGLICMLLWAWIDRSIWALVSSGIFSALTRVILSHACLEGNRNRWHWEAAAFWEIMHFGKWIFLSSVLGFLAINGDRLLLGSFVSPTTLGIYAIAYFMVSSIDDLVSRIIDISYPALSEIKRDRPTAFNAAYRRFHALVAAAAYLCCGGLIASGPTLIGILYDPRYRAAGWMLQILALSLVSLPLRLATMTFLVFGAPRMYSHIHAVRLVALFILVPLGFYSFGLAGALWGTVISLFLSLPLIVIHMKKYGFFELRRELMLMPVIGIGLIMGKLFVLVAGHFGYVF